MNRLELMRFKLGELKKLMEMNLEEKIPEKYQDEFIEAYNSLSFKYAFLGVLPVEEGDFELLELLTKKLI